MKALSLEDLRPQESEFYLRKTDKTYKLRAITLRDEKWLASTYGARLKEIFEQVQMDEICQIVFRLLSDEDKKDFAIREIEELNEKGEKIKVKRGGVELLQDQITGIAERIVIIKALAQTFGVSRELQEELAKEEKKSLKAVQRGRLAGEKSSTSSRRSTAGPGTISGGSRGEKSA